MCDLQGSSAPEYHVAQEREFYKFFQPFALGYSSRLEANQKAYSHPSSHTRHPSPDRALTAFAQLATFRLNCRRSYITFFDREKSYIVAEATKSLSLETQCTSQPGDEITFGATICPRSGSICEHTVAVPTMLDAHDRDVSAFVVQDCQKDDRFKSKSYTRYYGFRFYAGVAIVSPNGQRIGSYCVVDDHPREGLDPDELAFMKDMATTVMLHMDMMRAKSETVKGEKMVRGLGAFVEGKSTINDWWMSEHDRNSPSPSPSPPIFITSNPWAEKQYSMHHNGPVAAPQPSDEKHIKQGVGSLLHVETEQQKPTSADSPIKPITEEDPKSRGTCKQDTLSIEVKATFGRATKIMREALRVDGVCCFDAKAGHTFGGLVDQESVERPKRKSNNGDASRSNASHQRDAPESAHDDDDDDDDTTDPDGPGSPQDPDSSDSHHQDKPCEVLGFSTTDFSSINGDLSSKVTDGMTEKFLRSLLRRFPFGKTLNFDEHGVSTDEDGIPTEPPSDWSNRDKRATTRDKGLRKGESAFIRKIFPGVRSLAITPMWDSHQRFFSGCVAWTRSPYRILDPLSEVGYLAAFGDSIMAEVSRVEAKIADKAKSDFISSISHELRSPLHGILGSVECLQDSELDAFQENLVHTVETCGKTLLDTIDHLLEFAKINNFTKKATSRQGGTPGGKGHTNALDADVDLSVVTEEVLETVFAGHDFMRGGGTLDTHDDTTSSTSFAQQADIRRSSVPGFAHSHSSSSPVTVVVDIEPAERLRWLFRIQAGAWRRILMNLFGNSLKYTERGFVRVKLQSVPLPDDGKGDRSTVVLTVTDSGKGIARSYLEQSLFVPFAQEDSLQPGTGLGLAITAAIIHGMGGNIEVNSDKGHGTEIKVSLDLLHVPHPQDVRDRCFISSAARKTSGLKIGFVGFDEESSTANFPAGSRSPDAARQLFMASLQQLCGKWFDMKAVILHDNDKLEADLYLTTQQGIGKLQAMLDKQTQNHSKKEARRVAAAAPILVLCNSPATANSMLHSRRASEVAGIIEYISQPCGPLKLSKSLALCLERLEMAGSSRQAAPTMREVVAEDGVGRASDEKRGQGELDDRMLDERLSPTATGNGTSRRIETTRHSSHRSATGTHESGETDSHKPTDDSKSVIKKPAPPSRSSSSTKPPEIVRNVLLVDDNRINLQLLVTYITKTGHNFTTASDGQQALEAYKAQCETVLGASAQRPDTAQGGPVSSPFDFVLMDVSMPVMDGLESTRQIRSHERANNIAPTMVIALTGLASASAQQEAYVSGVNTFMTKPVKLKELGKLLEKGSDGVDGKEGGIDGGMKDEMKDGMKEGGREKECRR